MEMVAHQAVSIKRTIDSAEITIIIISLSHPIKSIDKLPIILFIFEDILVIDATHHHMATFGAASTVSRSLEHCRVVTKVNKVNIPVPDSCLA